MKLALHCCAVALSGALAAHWMRRLLAVSILAKAAADPVLVHLNGYCLRGKLLAAEPVSLTSCESLSLTLEPGRRYFRYPYSIR